MAAAPSERKVEDEAQAADAGQRLGGTEAEPAEVRGREIVDDLVGTDEAEPAGGGPQNPFEAAH